jgi:Leucine-rich repeat (LRR) protein
MPQCAVTAGDCQAGSRAKSNLAGPAQKTNNTAKDVFLDGSDLTPLLTRTGKSLTQLKVLEISYNQLTDVKGLEKLTQLTMLNLEDNPDLTKAQIDELQKALPNCKILSNPTK